MVYETLILNPNVIMNVYYIRAHITVLLEQFIDIFMFLNKYVTVLKKNGLKP